MSSRRSHPSTPATKHRSLSELIADYRRLYAQRLVDYLDYFEKLRSIEDAIRFACHGKEGKIQDHQRRVGKLKLEHARKKLQQQASKIQKCKSFDELIHLVKTTTSSIDRFGELAVYDTALRLGAYLNLWPEVVYLHAGTRKGCKAIGVVSPADSIEMDALPAPVQKLEPFQAEDFLCIFKDQFGPASGSRLRRSRRC